MHGMKMKRKTWIVVAIVCFLILCAFIYLPIQTASKGKFVVTEEAEIAVKDYGTITVSLCGEDAPEAVEHFISQLEDGTYRDLTFYRIVDGFMLQAGHAGDFSSFEITENTTYNLGNQVGLSHTRGAVSIPYSSDADGKMQFFIVQEDSTYLDGTYQVIGYVSDGMDIVDRICSDAIPIDDNGSISDSEQPVILSVTLCG